MPWVPTSTITSVTDPTLVAIAAALITATGVVAAAFIKAKPDQLNELAAPVASPASYEHAALYAFNSGLATLWQLLDEIATIQDVDISSQSLGVTAAQLHDVRAKLQETVEIIRASSSAILRT